MSLEIGEVRLDGRVFSGRERGELLRAELQLDAKDVSGDLVRIRVSEDVITITSSFFLGLLGPSIMRHRDPASFFEQYLIAARSDLIEDFDDYVGRARSNKQLSLAT